jgi:hypothetical protein
MLKVMRRVMAIRAEPLVSPCMMHSVSGRRPDSGLYGVACLTVGAQFRLLSFYDDSRYGVSAASMK